MGSHKTPDSKTIKNKKREGIFSHVKKYIWKRLGIEKLPARLQWPMAIILLSGSLFIAVVLPILLTSPDIQNTITQTNITVDQNSATQIIKFESDFDRYLLLELQVDLDNALHQYKMGLNNWKRLDYPRASHDISAARDAISEQKAQSLIEVAIINNSLGCLYLDMGKFDEAYDYLNSAFTVFKSQRGADSFETRAVRASIAQYYYAIGDYERALQETQEIIDNSDFEIEQVVVASTNHLRASIFCAVGNYEEALRMYDNSLNLYEEFLDDGNLSQELAKYTNDPRVDEQQRNYYTTSLKWIIRTYCNIGEVYLKMNKNDLAKMTLDNALEMCLNNVYIGKKNLLTAQIYKKLAVCSANIDKPREAVQYVEIAIAVERGLFNFEDEYPGIAETYRIFGDILFIQSKQPEALEQYIKALTLAVNALGEYHLYTADACVALGEYYLAINNEVYATEYLDRAINIRKGLLCNNHIDTARIYLALASAYEVKGDISQAQEAAQSAADIYEELGV